MKEGKKVKIEKWRKKERRKVWKQEIIKEKLKEWIIPWELAFLINSKISSFDFSCPVCGTIVYLDSYY